MKATMAQLATYIERDGASVEVRADYQIVRVPVLGSTLTYIVSSHQIDELNQERDRAYRAIQARRRAHR